MNSSSVVVEVAAAWHICIAFDIVPHGCVGVSNGSICHTTGENIISLLAVLFSFAAAQIVSGQVIYARLHKAGTQLETEAVKYTNYIIVCIVVLCAVVDL